MHNNYLQALLKLQKDMIEIAELVGIKSHEVGDLSDRIKLKLREDGYED